MTRYPICLHLSVIQYQGMEVCIAVGLQEDTKDIRLVECRSMVRFMWQMKMDSALSISVSSGVERANDETNALLREVIEYQKAILRKNVSVNMDSKRVDKQISKARNNAGFSFSPT